MTCECIKCKNCGAILVIDTKDLWKVKRCTKCESADIVRLDEEFDNAEVVGEEDE